VPGRSDAVPTVTVAPRPPTVSAPAEPADEPASTSVSTVVVPSAIPTGVSSEGCTPDSDFVADITIPAGTPMAGGPAFVKTWRLRNSGTCAWDSSYQLVQIEGRNILAESVPVALPYVPPGQEADISVTLRMSLEVPLGSQQTARFQLRAPDGTLFGTQPYVLVTASDRDGNVPAAGNASISGRVWLDYCHPGDAEGASDPDLGNCVAGAQGGKVADGLMQSGESGISHVKVELRQGSCSGGRLVAAVTDSSGSYRFIGLTPGSYCVAIDSLEDPNLSLLIPGGWTSPANDRAVAIIQFTLVDQEARTGADFGWDHQFD
jgi:hypothetical protein